MKVTIEDILDYSPNDFNGLDKTTFLFEGEAVYMFHKPENKPEAGAKLEGEISLDKGGRKKFKRAVANSSWGGTPYTGPKKGVPVGGGRDDRAIQAQWAIGQAVQLNLASATERSFDLIEADAKKFFAMIERVKTSDRPTVEDVKQTITEMFPGAEEL